MQYFLLYFLKTVNFQASDFIVIAYQKFFMFDCRRVKYFRRSTLKTKCSVLLLVLETHMAGRILSLQYYIEILSMRIR